MQRHIYLLFLVFLLSNGFAQKFLSLEVDYPRPRVGQKITLSFDDRFLTDAFNSQLSDKVRDASSGLRFPWFSDGFDKKIIEFWKIGSYKIGPFEFSFNGEHYLTDSLIIQVDEGILDEERIWIRHFKQNGIHHLILEQKIRNEFAYSTDSLTGVPRRSCKPPLGSLFSKVLEKPVNGVEIVEKRLLWLGQELHKISLDDPGYTYSVRIYEISFAASFQGDFLFTKDYLTDLPKKHKVKSIRITR